MPSIQNFSNRPFFGNSHTCAQVKENILLVTTTIACAVIIGSLLCILAQQGFSLGGINSISAIIGEKITYLTLFGGTGFLLINIVLIVSLTRSYYNKQLSQREINSLRLNEWIEREDVLQLLEPGQYWKFPGRYERPLTSNAEALYRQPVFGMIVRNSAGNIGVYAYQNEQDREERIRELGYDNIERSPVYPEAYVFSKIDNQQIGEELRTWIQTPIPSGRYESREIEISDHFHIHVLKRNDGHRQEVFFFKNPQLRAQNQQGFLNLETVKATVDYFVENDIYLIPNSFLKLSPVFFTPDGCESRDYYLILIKEDNQVRFHLCETLLEMNAFTNQLIQDGLIDARDSYENTNRWRKEWVELHLDPSDLESIQSENLQSHQIGTFIFTANTEAHEKIYALRTPIELEGSFEQYFKTPESLENFIEENHLSEYHDIPALKSMIEASQGIIENYSLKRILQNNKDYWNAEIDLHHHTFYLIIQQVNDKLDFYPFSSSELRQKYLNETPALSNCLNDFYESEGRYSSHWIQQKISPEVDEKIRSNLSPQDPRMFTHGTSETLEGTNVCWLSYYSEGSLKVDYFINFECLADYVQAYLSDYFDWAQCDEEAQNCIETKYLDLILTEEGQCWVESLIIEHKTLEVLFLFNSNTNEIEFEFPEESHEIISQNFYVDMSEIVLVKHQVPKSLGEYLLNSQINEKINSWKEKILPKEYVSFKSINTENEIYPQLEVLLVKGLDNSTTLHYFSRKEERIAKETSLGYINGKNRHVDNLAWALRISNRVNEYHTSQGTLQVPHILHIDYPALNSSQILKVINRRVSSEIVPSNETTTILSEAISQGFVNPLTIYPSLDLSENEIGELEEHEFGNIVFTRLNIQQYAIFDKSKYGYYFVVYKPASGERNRGVFFKSSDSLHEYISQNLHNYTQVEI